MTELRNNVSSDVNLDAALPDPKDIQELTKYVAMLLQQMEDRFHAMSDQITSRIDDMGTRIDELERTITDLMTQAGPDDLEK